MITLITGAPGAGKTAALVSMLAELGKDRAIYAHGIPDLKIPHVALDDPATWPDTVPDGSIVIIDEVQTIWRPSGPGQKLPDHIAKLETHRHRGIDFYIITQGPNLVHSNVRALVGRHVHLRDIGFLGRWWYEWPETADNCRTGWKNAPIKKRYRLPKHIFSSYKSASVHVKPVRSFPVVLLVLVAALLGVGWMGWSAYSTIQEKAFGGKLPTSLPTLPGQIVTTPKQPQEAGANLTQANYGQPIDDRIAWIPRVTDRPESAPAFDGLRQVVNMPQVVGGACFKGECRCYTQQGTDAGLSHHLCEKWIKNPPFDAYRPQVVQAAQQLPAQQRQPAEPKPQTVPMPEPQKPQQGQITQADIPHALALRRPSMADFNPIHPPTSLH